MKKTLLLAIVSTVVLQAKPAGAPGGPADAEKKITAEGTLKKLNKSYAEDLSKILEQEEQIDDIVVDKLLKSNNPDILQVVEVIRLLLARGEILFHFGLLLAALKPEAINAAKLKDLGAKFGEVLEKAKAGKAAALQD